MKKTGNRDERGYALIAMMSVMMFGLILMTSAAPKLKLESQREKEEEMFWRGQQIATALARYQRVRGAFPTDLADLVKGINVGIKKMRFLRPSALCDPMMPCEPGESNWRAVRPGDPLVKELLDAYIATREKGSATMPPPPGLLVQYAAVGASKPPSGLGLGSDNPPNDDNNKPSDGSREGQPGDKLNDNLKGPIIGVVSRRTGNMFRTYYGIDRYDKTLFFPDVVVMVSGFVNPLVLGGALASGTGPDPRCPRGGVFIEGRCWGSLSDGQCPPGEDSRKNSKCVPK